MNVTWRFWLCVMLVVINCVLAILNRSVDSLAIAGLCGLGALAFFVIENMVGGKS